MFEPSRYPMRPGRVGLVVTGRRATYPSDLTDEQWSVVGQFLNAWKATHPSVSGHQGRFHHQILGLFGTAIAGMRAKDVPGARCRVAAKGTERMRAKLTRLVARQILVEAEPGLLTLASATPSS